jgi:dephospho-CoA kinase
MLRVGLTGGLASGKSYVGRCLVEFGCRLIRADDLGHQVLHPGGAAYDAVVAEFGAGILDAEGVIDRKRLAAQVFDSPERLRRLTDLVHPAVWELEAKWMEEVAREVPDGVAVVEAAILIETGSYKRFDKLVVAVCTPQQQIDRAMKRDCMSREEALARLNRQMPLEEKRKYADYIVDTSGTKEHTREQTREVFRSLTGR